MEVHPTHIELKRHLGTIHDLRFPPSSSQGKWVVLVGEPPRRGKLVLVNQKRVYDHLGVRDPICKNQWEIRLGSCIGPSPYPPHSHVSSETQAELGAWLERAHLNSLRLPTRRAAVCVIQAALERHPLRLPESSSEAKLVG